MRRIFPTIVPWTGQGARPCDTRPRPAARRRGGRWHSSRRGDRRPSTGRDRDRRKADRVHAGSPQRNGGRSRPSPGRRGTGDCTKHVASVINPRGKPAYKLRKEWGWCRRGLIDVLRSSQAGFSKEILRKEVIQPQVPLRLPCYDLVPITGFIFGACLSAPTTSDAPRFGGLTGGVYKAQEHIHRRSADRRLLAIPASCGRVAARNPNWGTIFAISAALRPGDALSAPL